MERIWSNRSLLADQGTNHSRILSSRIEITHRVCSVAKISGGVLRTDRAESVKLILLTETMSGIADHRGGSAC